MAIDAGVDALAHVPDETEGTRELLAEAAARGIRVVPTLHMFAATVRPDESYTGPIRAALAGFVAAGGRVLFGTDVGYMPDRDTAPELEAMARAGLSVDAILVFDAEGIVESLNSAAERMFGYHADEVTGAPVSTIIDDPDTIGIGTAGPTDDGDSDNAR